MARPDVDLLDGQPCDGHDSGQKQHNRSTARAASAIATTEPWWSVCRQRRKRAHAHSEVRLPLASWDSVAAPSPEICVYWLRPLTA